MNLGQRFVLLLFVFVCVLNGCTKKHADDDEESRSSVPPVVAVKTALLKEGNIDVIVTAVGKTDVLRKVKVFSPIAGRILSFNVLEGISVKAGDVIATIQTKESYAAITGAEALLQAARTDVAREEAQRALDIGRSTQSRVSVRSKFDGVLATRNASEGELVAENAELATLLDLSTIVFTADVMLRDLSSLHVGQPCDIQFQSLPGHEFKAVVDAINPQTDIQSQTVKVRVRFKNPSENGKTLKTDMVGTARIVTSTHRNVLLIPRSALLRDDETNSFSIVVVTSDSLAKALPVNVITATDSTAEIAGIELQKGANVIVEGNYAMADSTKVTVVK